MKRVFLIAISFLTFAGFAQDSTTVLSYDSFIDAVMKNHPYSFQANIVQSMGEIGVKQSRGAFDPKLFGDIDQKYFDQSQYYSRMNAGLKIPTWFGLSAEAGYNLNDGVFLNPEQRVPSSGLWYAGLRLELGNGLIIDQRRAEFEKAKLYRSSSEFERTILLNQLQRDASIAYYQWQQAYRKASVYQLAYENASVRLEAVKNSALFGDRPYIDTVEASISVQNRQISFIQAKNYLENSELKLEMYLWSDGFIPLELENMIPESINSIANIDPNFELDTVLTNHPLIQINDLKLQQQKVDLKLKREQLKPNLALKYNAISEPVNGNPISNFSPENYTWGASFAYPILSRKERAGVQLAKLKIQDQELNNKMNVAQLEYKISSALNSYLTIIEQLKTTVKLVENNEAMYNAEKELFGLGESSVFMINSRESQWLKSRVQLIEVENQFDSLQAELKFQLMSFDLNVNTVGLE